MNHKKNRVSQLVQMKKRNLKKVTNEESLKQMHRALVESEERFQQLFYEAPLGYQSLDGDGNLIEINNQWLATLGYDREEVLGKWFGDFLLPEGQETFRERFPLFKKKGQIHSEFEMLHKNGSHRFIAFEGKIGYDLEGNFRQTHCILQDITERKENERALERERKEALFLIYHDQLTGLYNRRFYEDVLKKLDRTSNLPLSLLMGDVNGLKRMNDVFGHKQGDELIKLAAKVITKGCRADDIIARLGGDEFVVILPKVDTAEAERIIARIKELSLDYSIAGTHVSIAFGHATKINDAEDINDIFKKAEEEMYRHKVIEHRDQRNQIISLFAEVFNEQEESEKEISK
ncbi:MAG: GGDEF domain-containing protein [Acetobacterium woodii]|nr:GGDEF domain-containing protein [Acetobacterium woodii]